MALLRDRVQVIPASELDKMERVARTSIEDLRQTYVEISGANIKALQQLISAPRLNDETWRTSIYRIAHDLKGQGGTFGHELVTRIGHSLCLLIKKLSDRDAVDGDEARFTKQAIAHCEAMRVVLDQDIRGAGGDHGQALLKILSIEP